ncbi:zinc-binding protein A33-like isoform X2 [Salminus brasiliensis]|uniref:zinc-binding protein A33-like isoform X2 n=1 Tax=Salminus brasiliensis TaxID=930266 RepID=UPI003B835727
MAMKSSLTEKELSCHLCCDIYVDPVLLPCRHSFCQECLEEYRESKKSLKCPVCKKPSPKGRLSPNLQLQSLCDKFRQERKSSAERHETLCGLHGEKLKLFCLEDKEPVCVVCRESKMHSSHNFRPLDEAAAEHRSQARQAERRIKEEFQELHQFLQDEEENLLSALKEEEEVKSQAARNTVSSVNQEILHLSQVLTSTQEELLSEDIAFLKNYKASVERAEHKMEDPEILSGVLIDVAKHLGNLKFRVWEKMKDMIGYTPVILDPNTAHQRLVLSDDLTSLECKDDHQQLPKNPERYNHHLWVLGSEGFHSGKHYWDVKVENCAQWALGVVMGSRTKGRTFYCGGIWKCHYKNILYGASSSGGPTIILSLRENLRMVRVQLDWDDGQVLFYDLISGRLLQTFSYRFTEPVFPYFCNQCTRYSLRILPKETSTAIQPPKCSTQELTESNLATYSLA